MLIREEMNELPCLMPRWLPYHIKSEINSVHKQFSSCWYSTPSTAAAAVVDGWWQSPPKDPQLLTGGEISISTEEAIVYLAGLWMKETRWLPIHPPRWPLEDCLCLCLVAWPRDDGQINVSYGVRAGSETYSLSLSSLVLWALLPLGPIYNQMTIAIRNRSSV